MIAEDVIERVPPVAVTVYDPAVFRVSGKVPIPLERVAAAGRAAAESLEVMATELAKLVAVLL